MTMPSSPTPSARTQMYNTAPSEGEDLSAYAKRLLATTIGVTLVCVVIGLYVGLYLTNVPGSSASAKTPGGTQLYLATVAASAVTDAHPTWVSYYATDANDRNWRHTTTF